MASMEAGAGEEIGSMDQGIDSEEGPTEIFSAEEIANSVSHGIGLGMSIVGLIVLVIVASMNGQPGQLTSAIVYGSTLVLLFGASTAYHSMRRPVLRHVFRVIDHSAIYLLIAGSYTPFTLVSMRDNWGPTLLVIVWSMALIGVVYKIFWFGRFKGLSMALYLVMGWTMVVAIKPLMESLEMGGVILIFVGGVFYTGGVAFFAWNKLFLNHAIWHLFVLAAAVCHYLAILFYVMM